MSRQEVFHNGTYKIWIRLDKLLSVMEDFAEKSEIRSAWNYQIILRKYRKVPQKLFNIGRFMVNNIKMRENLIFYIFPYMEIFSQRERKTNNLIGSHGVIFLHSEMLIRVINLSVLLRPWTWTIWTIKFQNVDNTYNCTMICSISFDTYTIILQHYSW